MVINTECPLKDLFRHLLIQVLPFIPLGFSGDSAGKESSCNVEDLVLIPAL